MYEGIDYLETVISYDPGQARDYGGVCIVQGIRPHLLPDFGDRVDRPLQFIVGPMERLPLGTDYVSQRGHILDIWENLEYQFKTQSVSRRQAPTILLDITGTGRAIFDEIRHDADVRDIGPIIYGIQWTAGTVGAKNGMIFNTPKNDAIQSLIISAQNGQIKIRDDQIFATELKNELRNFRRKVSAAGNDTYAAAKESVHDDLTMSLAQAVWFIRKRHIIKQARAIKNPFY